MSDWSDEEMTLLKKLVIEGFSGAQIARQVSGLGTFRSGSAVIGRCLRSGLTLGGAGDRASKSGSSSAVARIKNGSGWNAAEREAGKRAMRKRKASFEARDALRKIMRQPERPPTAPMAIVDADPADYPHAVAFIETRPGQCRFIFGAPHARALCCGSSTGGGAYCETHAALCSAGKAA